MDRPAWFFSMILTVITTRYIVFDRLRSDRIGRERINSERTVLRPTTWCHPRPIIANARSRLFRCDSSESHLMNNGFLQSDYLLDLFQPYLLFSLIECYLELIKEPDPSQQWRCTVLLDHQDLRWKSKDIAFMPWAIPTVTLTSTASPDPMV